MKRTYGIRVDRRMAQACIQTLSKQKLFDTSVELNRTGDHVVIPLKREPSVAETNLLKERCDIEICQTIFVERKKKPADLREAVDGQIPEDLTPSLPRSFDVIGDIAVVDLPEELDHFASTVGHGILKVNPRLRLVLKKSSEVSGVFRTRTFEAIAGAGSTETTYREFASLFHLDVATVYFSSRLSHERMRVAKQVKQGECVVDMFAGVGPYSVLIAKTQPGARVYAIDVNPEAVGYLKANVLQNGVADRVIPIFGDARVLASNDLRGVASRLIMNLPSEAKGFLDAAVQALRVDGGIIHYYTFAARNESLDSVKDAMRFGIERHSRKVESFQHVRVMKEVSPNRVQVAIDAVVR